MEQQKTRIQKRKFRIGDLSKELRVKKFVIRFWEKEFDLKSDRSNGGQRFYTQDDLKTFATIKDLLYNKKFTIPGAKAQLAAELKSINSKPIPTSTAITPAQKTEKEIEYKTIEVEKIVEKIIEKPIEIIPQSFLEKLNKIKQELIKIKNSI